MIEKPHNILLSLLAAILIIGAVFYFKLINNPGHYTWSAPETDPVLKMIRLKPNGAPDTSYVAKSLFSTYNNSDQTASSSLEETVTQQVLTKKETFTNITAATIKPSIQYQLSNLNIQSDNNVDLKKYGTDIGTAFRPYGELSLEYLPVIAVKAMEDQDPSLLQPLTMVKISLVQRVGALSKMPVPESAKVLHLAVVNELLFLSELIYNMEKVHSEPIIGLESSKRYTVEYAKLLSLLSGYNAYFGAKNISFGPDEQVPIQTSLTKKSITP